MKAKTNVKFQNNTFCRRKNKICRILACFIMFFTVVLVCDVAVSNYRFGVIVFSHNKLLVQKSVT